MNIDINQYYQRLVDADSLPANDSVDLLKALQHYISATAYLASCQAATLESLPKSASKSSRNRHMAICRVASELLDGNAQSIRYPTDPTHAKDRCIKAWEQRKDDDVA